MHKFITVFGAASHHRRLHQLLVVVLLMWQVAAFAEVSEVKPKEPVIIDQEWRYSVQLNESFAHIQQKYLTQYRDIDTIAKLNRHPVTKKLQPNQILCIPLALLKKQAKPIEVVLVVGSVVYRPQESANSTSASRANRRQAQAKNTLITPQDTQQPLQVNTFIHEGDVLITGVNSLVKLRFADDSSTVIQPNTHIKIAQSFQYAGQGDFVTTLKLMSGRTEVLANPNRNRNSHFSVETPSAVAAVRGTSFRVGAEGDLALQETLAGEVAFVASGEEVLLSKGFGSAAEGDKPPLPPVLLPDAPNVSNYASVVDSLPVTFPLYAQVGTVAWVSQLASDAEFTQILSEQLIPAASSEAPINLNLADLADGQYFLKLRAKDSNGLQGNDATHAFKVAARPLPPRLISPENNSVITEMPLDLSWTLVDRSHQYLVEIAEDAAFTQILLSRVTSFGRLQLHSAMLTSNRSSDQVADSTKKTYFWRVANLINHAPVKFSKPWAFSR